MKKYDYLIVGAGLFGAVFAHEATKHGKKCLVIDKRSTVGGNCYTENCEGINVHKYGAHIFHTSDKEVWDYVCKFAEFNNYINSPVAVYNDELYNLPFNMNTFSKMWNIKTPAEAKAIIDRQKAEVASLEPKNLEEQALSLVGRDVYEEAKAIIDRQKAEVASLEPKNLEEQALSLVGRDVYEKLIKGYTQKQWGRPCDELPAFIIKRLPLRFTYDNNYFNDRYQGIPIGGYTQIVEKLLDGCTVQLDTDYFEFVKTHKNIAAKTVYTGEIDKFFDYRFGALQWRAVRFDTEILNVENFQGNAVVNYTDAEVPYTRIIEHKHFEKTVSLKTVISREYSSEWKKGDEPYYPINDEKNDSLYLRYKQLADAEKNVIFGGRLGTYKYYDMDKVVRAALDAVKREFEQ